jgi:adenylate kinase family enzyme
MLPEIFFIIGPKSSGKSALGSALADRTNMTPLNFTKFIKDNGLKGKDDEVMTMTLIKHLVNETAPRILIEDFPQNQTQAKLFIKNCLQPSEVFYVKCSKDTCQERMLEIGSTNPNYLPSSILSKKIKKFHDSAATLLPFLAKNTKFNEIDTEQTFSNSFKDISKVVEPTIIHVRSGGSNNDLRKEIV